MRREEVLDALALAALDEVAQALPEGTLGREYVEFYRRNNLTLPGDDPNSPAVFVAHDMTHVIAGIDTSAQGEVALGAFQMAMDDNDVNVSAMISSFIIHEAGFGTPTTIAEAQHDVLLRPGAIDLLGQEIARGAARRSSRPKPIASSATPAPTPRSTGGRASSRSGRRAIPCASRPRRCGR